MLQSNTTSPRFRPEQPFFVVSGEYYCEREWGDDGVSLFYGLRPGENSNLTLAIPDGCTDILFDCDVDQPLARVCGTTLAAREANLQAGHRYFGVRFMPGVMPDFLDLVPADLPDHEFRFLDVAPGACDVVEKISLAASFSQQIALFTHRFAPHCLRRSSSITPYLLKVIRHQRGNIRIDDMEKTTGYTCRSIQRHFRQDTGMSPKAFCRIMRFQSAIHTLNYTGAPSFTMLAQELGYSDQSHFLREFKRLSHTTPGDYHRQIIRQGYGARITQG